MCKFDRVISGRELTAGRESEPAEKSQRRQEDAPRIKIKEELNMPEVQLASPATPLALIGMGKLSQTESAEEKAVPGSDDEEP